MARGSITPRSGISGTGTAAGSFGPWKNVSLTDIFVFVLKSKEVKCRRQRMRSKNPVLGRVWPMATNKELTLAAKHDFFIFLQRLLNPLIFFVQRWMIETRTLCALTRSLWLAVPAATRACPYSAQRANLPKKKRGFWRSSFQWS